VSFCLEIFICSVKIAESWLARATHQCTSTKCKQEVFQVLAEARSLEELRLIEPKAREVYGRFFEELENADLKDLAIPPKDSRLNYSRRCAEASAVQAHMSKGFLWLRDGNKLLGGGRQKVGSGFREAHWSFDAGFEMPNLWKST
jgi:hypothetical protein